MRFFDRFRLIKNSLFGNPSVIFLRKCHLPLHKGGSAVVCTDGFVIYAFSSGELTDSRKRTRSALPRQGAEGVSQRLTDEVSHQCLKPIYSKRQRLLLIHRSRGPPSPTGEGLLCLGDANTRASRMCYFPCLGDANTRALRMCYFPTGEGFLCKKQVNF